jgi:hypothetical protein
MHQTNKGKHVLHGIHNFFSIVVHVKFNTDLVNITHNIFLVYEQSFLMFSLTVNLNVQLEASKSALSVYKTCTKVGYYQRLHQITNLNCILKWFYNNLRCSSTNPGSNISTVCQKYLTAISTLIITSIQSDWHSS